MVQVGYPLLTALILGFGAWMLWVSVMQWKMVVTLTFLKDAVTKATDALEAQRTALDEHRQEDAANFSKLTTRVDSFIEFHGGAPDDREHFARRRLS